jgi:hypothetical protein
MRTSGYHGPAREFAEGSEHFEIMFERALDFLDYAALWGGYGGLKPDDVKGMSDQQSKLGLARAMALAIEKNPLPEKTDEANAKPQTHQSDTEAGGTAGL